MSKVQAEPGDAPRIALALRSRIGANSDMSRQHCLMAIGLAALLAVPATSAAQIPSMATKRLSGVRGRVQTLKLRRKLVAWRALAAVVTLPKWATQKGAPDDARDDDLHTAWRCEPVRGKAKGTTATP